MSLASLLSLSLSSLSQCETLPERWKSETLDNNESINGFRNLTMTKNITKTLVTLDVKPWDNETDMMLLEQSVRGIEKDGLVFGASKLVDVGFGIKKLHIVMVVEDEKVSVTDLQEELEGMEDYVQSTDVVSMQKL